VRWNLKEAPDKIYAKTADNPAKGLSIGGRERNPGIKGSA